MKTGKVRADTTVVSANVDYPTDSGLVARAVRRMSRLVRRIKAVGAASRTLLHQAGVNTVAIPRKGPPGTARQTHERQPGFRRLIKWRTGCEGRISHHHYQWDRTRLDRLTGARIWCGYGILAHNLTKITALATANT